MAIESNILPHNCVQILKYIIAVQFAVLFGFPAYNFLQHCDPACAVL